MKRIIFAVFLLSLSALAQNSRYDGVGGGNNATVAVCSSPANGVPCTNYATTYNSAGVACSNSAQDTPQPQPSNCQPTVDSKGSVGFWAPAGTYDYTVCAGGSCSGPFTVTLGSSTAGGCTEGTCIRNAPAGDQSITGAHQLINLGFGRNGPPLASFDANVQDQAYDPANGDTTFSSGIIDGGTNLVTGLQGIGQGKEATGVTGLASGTTDNTQAFPTGGFLNAYLRTTQNNTLAFPIGAISDATSQPDAGTTSFGAVGLETQALNQGLGISTTLSSLYVAPGKSLVGTVLNNYGVDAKLVFDIGTTNNAVIHAVDQGSAANHYGILLEGVTHNDLGGGVTKVGLLQEPLSTPANSSATCATGQIWADAGFVYVCTASNTIKRSALSAF